MNIFKELKLYPNGEESILSNFAGFYGCVFIAYLPFFRIKEHNFEKASVQKSHQICLEEFKVNDEVFGKLPNFNANIYSYENFKQFKLRKNHEVVSFFVLPRGERLC